MSYVLRRLRSTAKHLMSIRGALMVAAGVSLVGSLFSSGWVTKALVLVAAGALGLLLLMMSLRQSEDHAQIANLRRHQKKLSRISDKRQPASAPARSVDRVGPNTNTRKTERIEQARIAILAVRGDFASAIPQSRPDSTAQPAPLGAPETGPTVTVVVPCCNKARSLSATLESVHRQSFTNWECIVVDDASTDTSITEARRFTKTDDRFRLARHKVNSGASAARNTGLRMARGRYITFLDSDDMLMSDSLLDRLETLVDTEPATAGAYCGIRIVPEDVTLDSLPPHENWPDPWFVDFVSAAAECPFNTHAPLLRTEVVRSVGGFDETMRDGVEDWSLWLRMMRRGFNFVPSKWQTAVSRQKHESIDKEGAERHVREAQRQITRSYHSDASVTAHPGVLHRFPLPLPTYQEQLVHARRALEHAATSIALGDRTSAESILTGNDVAVEPWMDNHIGFKDVINAGFCRALGLNATEVSELAEELEPLSLQIMSLIVASRPKPDHAATAPIQQHRFDTLFVPQNAAQARAMIEVADDLPTDHPMAFLNVERIGGPQGVAALVAETSHPFFSVNEWMLQGNEHRNLVVAFPRDATVEELIAATKAKGGRVVEIPMGGEDIMRVDQRPDYGHDLARVDKANLAKWLTNEPLVPFLTSTGSPDGAMLWHGATDPDPDAAFAIEEYPDTAFDATDMERFKGIHPGERCVIIGNGPSLNDLDLTKLKSEYTIGVNGIFYATDQMGFDLSYYVVEDTMVIRDNLEAIKAYPAGHKFFPTIYRDQVGEAPNVSYFMMNRGFYEPSSPSFCVPRFSTDPSQRLYSGQSVTIINLQLAYYMGFSEIVMIGMDFSYIVPEGSKVDGSDITSIGDDPNHFHPDYFGKGKIWKDPKLDRVRANYQLAKVIYEADGRRIVNATPGGKLDLFDRVPYEDLFG